MQRSQTHTIQRQTLEFEVADAGDAQRIRQQADLLCRSKMAPLLDRVFSSVVDQDRVLQLDRLDLRVNISCPARFDEEFVPGVEQAIQEALQSILAENGLTVIEKSNGLTPHVRLRPPGGGGADDEAQKPPGPVSDGIRADADRQRRGRRRANVGNWGHARAEMLVSFLKTGRLPWWAPPREAHKLEEHLKKTVHDANAAAALELESLFKDPHCRKRLARQFSSDTLCDVIAVLVGEAVSGVRNHVTGAMVEMAQSCGVRRLPDDRVAQFWEIVLEAATAPGFSVNRLQLVIQKSGFGTTRQSQSEKNRRTVSAGAGDAPGTPEGLGPAGPPQPETAYPPGPDSHPPKAVADLKQEEMAPVIAGRAGKAANGRPPVKRGTATPGGGSAVAAFFPQADDPAGRAAPHDLIGQEEPRAHQTDRNPAHAVAIENAGLVLLWPYLGRFFQGLDLTGQHGFRDPLAACRGVHLLQYLAFGATGFAEPHLLLNKILCGLPADFPVTRRVRLDPKEQNACRTLLQAVIGHWQALKNTTIQGLQTAFLQRFGLLSRTDTGWGLRVDRNAYDLLLNRLPWGIAVVRLSWMAQALMVEW